MTAGGLQWDGGQLEGTAWQGIAFLSYARPGSSLDPATGAPFVAQVTVHLNQPTGGLQENDVIVRGGRRLPPPPHVVMLGAQTIDIGFRGLGDHSPYTVELTDGGDHALHPFFASAAFTFTIECPAGDCHDAPASPTPPPRIAPAIDLLTKDFNGFVRLMTDWMSAQDPGVVDPAPASQEQMLVEVLAWFADLTSYHQDRVAAEAFLETARQRFSIRQHALLLGAQIDEGAAPRTLLAFDVEHSGFVPGGLEVRTPVSGGEMPVVYTVAARTAVAAAHSSARLRLAAFPGARDAVVPAGSTELLLWGHDDQLEVGDRIAVVQGPWSQILTLRARPQRLVAPGWVAHPDASFDPAVDAPAAVSVLRVVEPLQFDLRPWSATPLRLHANLVDVVHGQRRRAVVGTQTVAGAGDLPVPLTPSTSIVRPGPGGVQQLRALRLPDWPIVHDADETGAGVPAVEVEVRQTRWTRRAHLHASRAYDLHYTAAADESGAVWLQFGDGRGGRDVAVDASGSATVDDLVITYRIGDAAAGNVALGAVSEIVPPSAGGARASLDGLGAVNVSNVIAATGGRRPQSSEQVKEQLLASLRGGPLARAVELNDYAAVASAVPGVARATARAGGRLFKTVVVLVDPDGGERLSGAVRHAVEEQLDQLRMTGVEHVVAPAEYLPLEVELLLCTEPGSIEQDVRDRVLAELRPGSAARPGWFHPDRLSFGDVVRVGDLLAFVQHIDGVRSVKATAFRPQGARSGPAVQATIRLGRTQVARLDADDDYPEHGVLRVRTIGVDAVGRELLLAGGIA